MESEAFSMTDKLMHALEMTPKEEKGEDFQDGGGGDMVLEKKEKIDQQTTTMEVEEEPVAGGSKEYGGRGGINQKIINQTAVGTAPVPNVPPTESAPKEVPAIEGKRAVEQLKTQKTMEEEGTSKKIRGLSMDVKIEVLKEMIAAGIYDVTENTLPIVDKMMMNADFNRNQLTYFLRYVTNSFADDQPLQGLKDLEEYKILKERFETKFRGPGASPYQKAPGGWDRDNSWHAALLQELRNYPQYFTIRNTINLRVQIAQDLVVRHGIEFKPHTAIYHAIKSLDRCIKKNKTPNCLRTPADQEAFEFFKTKIASRKRFRSLEGIDLLEETEVQRENHVTAGTAGVNEGGIDLLTEETEVQRENHVTAGTSGINGGVDRNANTVTPRPPRRNIDDDVSKNPHFQQMSSSAQEYVKNWVDSTHKTKFPIPHYSADIVVPRILAPHRFLDPDAPPPKRMRLQKLSDRDHERLKRLLDEEKLQKQQKTIDKLPKTENDEPIKVEGASVNRDEPMKEEQNDDELCADVKEETGSGISDGPWTAEQAMETMSHDDVTFGVSTSAIAQIPQEKDGHLPKMIKSETNLDAPVKIAVILELDSEQISRAPNSVLQTQEEELRLPKLEKMDSEVSVKAETVEMQETIDGLQEMTDEVDVETIDEPKELNDVALLQMTENKEQVSEGVLAGRDEPMKEEPNNELCADVKEENGLPISEEPWAAEQASEAPPHIDVPFGDPNLAQNDKTPAHPRPKLAAFAAKFKDLRSSDTKKMTVEEVGKLLNDVDELLNEVAKFEKQAEQEEKEQVSKQEGKKKTEDEALKRFHADAVKKRETGDQIWKTEGFDRVKEGLKEVQFPAKNAKKVKKEVDESEKNPNEDQAHKGEKKDEEEYEFKAMPPYEFKKLRQSPDMFALTSLKGEALGEGDHKYELKEIIGSGTYGLVFGAKNVKSGKIVALKLVTNKNILETEISVMKKIREHEPVNEFLCVPTHSISSSWNNVDFCAFTMDLLKVDLFHLNFCSRPLKFFPSRTVFMILEQILSAIAFLNRIGLVYADMKLDNVMLKDFGVVKSGSKEMIVNPVARLIDVNTSFHIGDSYFCQSAPYRAPEVILDMNLTEKIDSFSCGCLAVELLHWEKKQFIDQPDYPQEEKAEQVAMYQHLARIETAMGKKVTAAMWKKTKNRMLQKPSAGLPMNPNQLTLKSIVMELKAEKNPIATVLQQTLPKLLQINPDCRLTPTAAYNIFNEAAPLLYLS